MKILYIALLALVVSTVGSVATTERAAAVANCYGTGSTTREDGTSSISRRFQTFVAPSAPITAFTWNLYGAASGGNMFHGNILETVGGVPDDGNIFPGSIVQIPVSALPDFPVGTGQYLDCGDLDTARVTSQTFTFSSPLVLIPGVTYAMGVHETNTFSQSGSMGHNTGNPIPVPGEGYFCNNITQPCGGLAGLTEFPGGSGINYDFYYVLHDTVIDIDDNDGKIDTHIFNLREYLQLDGTDGGLIFGVGVIAFVFAVGLMAKIPFMAIAMLNLLLAGMFAMAKIVPPWILLAVIAVAGLAVVLRLLGGNNRGESV